MTRFERKSNIQFPRKVIRIYTEGEKTEPNYFGSIRNELRLPEIHIDIHGMGDHTMSLVDYVIKEKESDKEDTEWWVVFDRDDHNEFDASIQKAESYDINVAYSNESFELWFILHFEFLNTAIGRDSFPSKLSKLIGKKYEKSCDIYPIIKTKESDAIRNAKNLEKQHNDDGVILVSKRDPSTSVYKLVESLRSLKKD